MYEDYDFIVPRDENGVYKRTVLRTVRTGQEEVLIIGVKEIDSKVTTRNNSDFEVVTISSIFLNSEYNLGFVDSTFCDKERSDVNSIECIQVIQGDRRIVNIENGFDGNNLLTHGNARIDGVTGPLFYSFLPAYESNIYPFENVRVNNEIRNFLGLNYNPQTQEIYVNEEPNITHK